VDQDTLLRRCAAPVGTVEPHGPLLSVPPQGQLLYKIMTVENLSRSIAGAYLHFNRVDSYSDFPDADPHDGQQLPRDQQGNATARFAKKPEFSVAGYYDQSRSRTYACCFSLENSDFIWASYANGSQKGKVCIVFEFGKLRAAINETLQAQGTELDYNGNRCRQIFSVNYGIMEYVDWNVHQANAERLPNPIKYTYLKDSRFCNDRELRVSLSTLGLGQFALNDGSRMSFPVSLQMIFDFKAAIADGTIRQILCAPDCDTAFLLAQLDKLCIAPSGGSDLRSSQRGA
jgi:hypothetical protein